MRGLEGGFLKDLKTGLLAPLLERVKADQPLCLEIRGTYVNIYYRGGNLLKLATAHSRYKANINPKYAKGDGGVISRGLPSEELHRQSDIDAWIKMIPTLKLTMDIYLGQRPKKVEREIQQLILRDNNLGGVSRATDYFICDIEYAIPHGRFDMVAVHWPSDGATRKQNASRRLVLIEVKCGEGAIGNKSGIHDHINDINTFLSDATRVQAMKDEMVVVFNQKRDLGLLNCGKDLKSFGDELPMLLLLLVNHDPDSERLRTQLQQLPPSPHAEVYLATSCFMGYGLFDQAVLKFDEAMKRFPACF